MKKAAILMTCLGILLLPFPLKAKTLKVIHHVGRVDGVEVTNLKFEGKAFEIGAYITVEYDLKNVSPRPLRLGRHGAIIACRDPQKKNRDFGAKYKNSTLERGKKVHIKGVIRIDKFGRWTFWPGFQFKSGHWGPYQWHAVKFTAKRVVTITPPYATYAGWKTSPGDLIKGSQAHYYANASTGFIGLHDAAFAGGAASEVLHYFTFYCPKNQRVRIQAYFYYVGGAKTVGLAAFAGLQAGYKFRGKYGRKDITAGLNYDIAIRKIIDIALSIAPELTESKTIKEALEALKTVNEAIEISHIFIELHNIKREAKRYTYNFTVKAKKGINFIGVGLRANCSGMVTGSSYCILAGQLNKVNIYY